MSKNGPCCGAVLMSMLTMEAVALLATTETFTAPCVGLTIFTTPFGATCSRLLCYFSPHQVPGIDAERPRESNQHDKRSDYPGHQRDQEHSAASFPLPRIGPLGQGQEFNRRFLSATPTGCQRRNPTAWRAGTFRTGHPLDLSTDR